jgi:Na+/H+ antiporter NhaC
VALLSHLISYASGSSFGTMGIVFPLVGPLAHAIGNGDRAYLLHCIGAALGGATFGNVCSPISDTTILSVLATKCDLQAHVATITPYALLAAATALLIGEVPVGAGLYGPVAGLLLGTGAMTAFVRVFGK